MQAHLIGFEHGVLVNERALGPLEKPGVPLQKPQLYTAGVFAGSSNADAARELLAFLTSSAAREKLSAAGVVPSNSSVDSVR
jgi:ABC-type glycerol-3-phosphate transport system substrate-binding protein